LLDMVEVEGNSSLFRISSLLIKGFLEVKRSLIPDFMVPVYDLVDT